MKTKTVLRMVRVMLGLFKLWIVSCCALIVLCVLGAAPGVLLAVVFSLPVPFLIACAIILPSPQAHARGHGFSDDDTFHYARRTFDEFDFPSHERHRGDEWDSTPVHSYEYTNAETMVNGFESSHKTTVLDLNSDGTFAIGGTGTMSSGLSDF